MTNITVEATIPYVYVVPGFEPKRGDMALLWEQEFPFQLTVDFHTEESYSSSWILGRDMFVDCMLVGPGPTFGGGDAALDRGMATFNLKLHSPDGDASLTFPISPMIPFLTQTLQFVPRGEQESELIEAEMAAFLEEVLSEDGDQ